MAAPLVDRDDATRDNEVLQFLLGNTDEITSEDACSVASTSSAHSSDTPVTTTERVSWRRRGGNDRSPTAMDLWDMPEIEPICDTESDNEVVCHKVAAAPIAHKPSMHHTLIATISSITNTVTSGWNVRTPQGVRTHMDAVATKRQKPSASRRLRPSQRVETKHEPAVTTTDLVSLAVVTLLLIAYCLAILYRFIVPLHVPLPDSRLLYTPWDVSNVSLRMLSPTSSAPPCIRRGQPFEMAWELVHFPAAALRQYGSEPFHYRVLLNNDTILSEVGFWSHEEARDQQVLNKSLSYRFRAREVDAAAAPVAGQGEELRLVVSFPIPGSDGAIQILEQRVTCRPPSALTIQRVRVGVLELLTPLDGAIVQQNEPILVKYVAASGTSRIQRVRVVVDDTTRTVLGDMKEGNVLLRGLGVGLHTVEVQALDPNDDVVIARAFRITVAAS